MMVHSDDRHYCDEAEGLQLSLVVVDCDNDGVFHCGCREGGRLRIEFGRVRIQLLEAAFQVMPQEHSCMLQRVKKKVSQKCRL